MDRTVLTWNETVRTQCVLDNQSGNELGYVNYTVKDGRPMFVLTDEHGVRFEFGDPPESWDDSIPRAVASGQAQESECLSGDCFPFPHAGVYDLCARYHWFEEGERVDLESEPVRVNVIPTRPDTLCVATGSGALSAGQVYATWVDAPGLGSGAKQGTLWLTTILAFAPAQISSSVAIASVPPDVRPVLSAPALTGPRGQWIAWIDGDALCCVLHSNSRKQDFRVPLGAPDYLLVPPILETASGAEALLVRMRQGSWEMRTVKLGDGSGAGEPVIVNTPAPGDGRTVYGPDGRCRSVFFRHERPAGGDPRVELSLSNWSSGAPPKPPVPLLAWPGAPLAYDFAIRPDNTALGGILLHLPGEPFQFEMRAWTVLPSGEFQPGPAIPFRWEHPGAIKRAVLKMGYLGEPLAVFQDSEDVWHRAAADGIVQPLKHELQTARPPLDLFWVDHVYPAVVYNQPGSGLRIGYFSDPPRQVPPVSAGFTR